MTFYSEQVKRMNSELYSKEYLTQQIIRAKQHIDKSFSDDLSLDELAAKAFLSKFHFIRLFKSLYGRTPHQYLVSVRIENAKRLLQTQRPISDICISVGFNSCTSFTALFKKITGYTPSAFKQKSNFQEPF
ncbi:MAG: AraC family transcriptional regulator [Ferruginibacter sp.]